ncbi:hypothetical protein BpHYR1_044511 [Brachionus plicatilis]|uniref:Uncharacterized protein n=1 Tax=Brachionus plicatilis TaxID=10195 RepID=A0A3M7SZH2_BRAPC|nr:hypothetical protein BpHYR1_044511 [Brachionus plicatilis]
MKYNLKNFASNFRKTLKNFYLFKPIDIKIVKSRIHGNSRYFIAFRVKRQRSNSFALFTFYHLSRCFISHSLLRMSKISQKAHTFSFHISSFIIIQLWLIILIFILIKFTIKRFNKRTRTIKHKFVISVIILFIHFLIAQLQIGPARIPKQIIMKIGLVTLLLVLILELLGDAKDWKGLSLTGIRELMGGLEGELRFRFCLSTRPSISSKPVVTGARHNMVLVQPSYVKYPVLVSVEAYHHRLQRRKSVDSNVVHMLGSCGQVGTRRVY